jgi:hypothetical protein
LGRKLLSFSGPSITHSKRLIFSNCWKLNCKDGSLLHSLWTQLRLVLMVYMYIIITHNQHTPFRKCSSFVDDFLLPLPLAGKEYFEFSYSVFNISTRGWENTKNNNSNQMYYWWSIVSIMHTLTCIFSKLLGYKINIKYMSIPKISNKETTNLGYDKIRDNQ